jgi:hypothetical protein
MHLVMTRALSLPRTAVTAAHSNRRFVVEFDQHLATNALGNDARPLTKENITNFLDDFGLEPEFGLHSHIRGLSGGLYSVGVAGFCGGVPGFEKL